MLLKKNTTLGKIKLTKILFYFFIFFYFSLNAYASQNNKKLTGNFVEIKILDKVSSQTSQLKLNILEEAKFENPFAGSAFGVGNSQEDGIVSCVLCNRSPYCSGSETNRKYKLMWWYENKMQDFTIIAPN